MKTSKRFGMLTSTAMLGLLYLGGAGSALAAASQNQPAQIGTAASAPLLHSTNYYWHGRHYAYVWHGRYFNHRSWRNNQWFYFG